MNAMSTGQLENFRATKEQADAAATLFTLACGKKAENVGGGTVQIEFPRKSMLKHGANFNTIRVDAQHLLKFMDTYAAGKQP